MLNNRKLHSEFCHNSTLCVALSPDECPLQVYWCGPLLGGIAAALLYENVFAVNASLSKAKGFLLAADYDPEDYEPNKEQPAEVTLFNMAKSFPNQISKKNSI